jgi:hypothetical protein
VKQEALNVKQFLFRITLSRLFSVRFLLEWFNPPSLPSASLRLCGYPIPDSAFSIHPFLSLQLFHPF